MDIDILLLFKGKKNGPLSVESFQTVAGSKGKGKFLDAIYCLYCDGPTLCMQE